MLPGSLKKLFDDNGIAFTTIRHDPTYTAQEIAASAHVPGQNLAKTVMVKLDGKLAMAVLPAHLRIDLERLRQAVGAERAELAAEEEFADLFPDFETGAMPPFGNLYGLDVYVAESLAADEEIAFNAGTHTDLALIAYRDFERLVQPKVIAFATRH